MRGIDFSSWQGVLSTLAGLVLITLLGVGIRLLVMQTLQQRRERENRQINERLRTLMAAYKTLGGSFTGELGVDPSHRRDLRQREDAEGIAEPRSDRARRIRDAVEVALSDILLLGTDEQVRLAARAANDLAQGRPVHTHELVVSLRDFVREALDLAPIPADLQIPPCRYRRRGRPGRAVPVARAATTATPRAVVRVEAAVAAVAEWGPAWAVWASAPAPHWAPAMPPPAMERTRAEHVRPVQRVSS